MNNLSREPHCNDCEISVRQIGEWYIVFDSVWKEAINNNHNIRFLCIGCLETRLNRKLKCSDFARVPLNSLWFGRKSDRLKKRLGGKIA